MEQLTYRNFVKEIAKDFNLSPDKEYKLKIPADKKVLKNFVRGDAYRMRIFDGMNEHPYMINNTVRNDEAFSKAIELRYLGEKGLATILEETGLKLKSEKCKICEGGGWYSEGTKYFYKDYYAEV
jgi:hypothetical protein